MAKQKVFSALIVFETEPHNMARTRAFVLQCLKSTFQSLRNANIAIAIYDENGVQVGIDITGNPSDEMKKLMDSEFAPEEIVS